MRYPPTQVQQSIQFLLVAVVSVLFSSCLSSTTSDTHCLYIAAPAYVAAISIYLTILYETQEYADALQMDFLLLLIAVSATTAFGVYLSFNSNVAAAITVWVIVWSIVLLGFVPVGNHKYGTSVAIVAALFTSSYVFASNDTNRILITAGILSISSVYMYTVAVAVDPLVPHDGVSPEYTLMSN